ncbi:SDR family oxidoreductase [Hyphococcus formosus]|uniref:SDR family oxidoreductase n=1 Tax=Hyphococcus formosus TaxID=3143534 RepID=UPI00398B7E87
MTKTFERTAIVTGASRGIGRAIASRLANDGFNIVANFAGNEKAAQDLVQNIEQLGGKAIAVQADVADSKAVKQLFDIAQEAFNGVDALINNAGIMKLSTIAESDDALFDTQIATNLKGSFNTMREAAAHLKDGGSVINLSTSVVGLNLETYGVYASTKAAIETMTKIFAKELRGRNITVNAVAPGPTATDLFLDGKPKEVVDRLAKMPPLERLGTPEDIANAIAFLASPDGHWINGQVLRANGGMI